MIEIGQQLVDDAADGWELRIVKFKIRLFKKIKVKYESF
jgi:hypothetical protein